MCSVGGCPGPGLRNTDLAQYSSISKDFSFHSYPNDFSDINNKQKIYLYNLTAIKENMKYIIGNSDGQETSILCFYFSCD